MNSGCPVYIVDDDRKTRQYLVRLLREHGFEPTPFASGSDFIEALDFLTPGIALLELRLAGIGGMAVQEELLARRLDVPLIVMTASGDISTAVHVIKRGALDFLEKPFSDGQLFDMLANARPLMERSVEIQRQRERAKIHLDSLTKRELDILRALSARSTNRDVADALHTNCRDAPCSHQEEVRSKEFL
ncbi:response regulator [Sphingobium sp.]|uniref:response regulator transcription factor n=1 Tax=Sphingobium sp. TaxID=1912891 RepID=UPI0028BE77BF|nr:response regulator [Sphingobium sp.]